MKYTYAYKTSDGTRHEASMDAESREQVFAALRERGIRAIKVTAADGSKANGEARVVVRKRLVFAALAVGLVSGLAGAFWYGAADHRDARLIELERRAEDVIGKHRSAIATLNLDALSDWQAIAAAKVPGLLDQRISLCYHDLDGARSEIRTLFREPMASYTDDPGAHAEVRRIYGAAMDELDLIETRFVKAEKAYRLLDTNRGEWSLYGSSVVFSNPELQKKFANLTREIETK